MALFESVKQIALDTAAKFKAVKRNVNQTDTDRQIVDLVRQLYRTRDERYNLEMQWDFNRRFYRGEQDVVIIRDRETETQRITTLPETDYRTGITVNLILPTVTNRTSEMIKSRPIIFTKPKTDELSDSSKATTTNAAVKYAKEKFKYDTLNAEAYTITQLVGKAFYKVYWDSNAGDEVQVELTPEIRTNEDGTQEEIKRTEFQRIGDIKVSVIPADQGLASRNAQKMEDVTWFLHFYDEDVERLVLQNPRFEKQIRAAHRADSVPIKIDSDKYTAPQPDHDRVCTVHELYMKPCPKYKEGLYAKVVGDYCLEYSDLPDGLWPFVELQEFPSPDGSFWPESVVSQLIPLNRALNMHVTQMLAYQHNVCRAPVIIYKGSGIKPSQITNSPSDTLECSSPAFKPEILMPPNMPGDMFATSNMLLSFFEEVSRVGKASKGQNIPGGRSYQVLALAKEQDQQYMMSSAYYFEKAQLELTKLILRLMRLHYEDGRIMSFLGQNNLMEAQEFKRELIIENDLDIEAFSSIPQSKTMVEQRVINLAQAGIINPAQDRKAVLEALELSSLDKFNADILVDDREVNKENKLIMKGIDPGVYKGQNHAAHIKGHLELVKKDEYKIRAAQPSKITAPPEQGQMMMPGAERPLTIDELRLNHIQNHTSALMDEVVQQTQMNAQIANALGMNQGGNPPQGGQSVSPQAGNQMP